MRVTLNGYVCSDDDLEVYSWFDISAFSPRTLRQAIEQNPVGEELVLEVNSPGGSVFAGFEMYSILRGAPCDTRAEIQSLAASAASTMAIGCGTVLMSPVAQMMIHLPTTVTSGDRNDHRDSIRALDSITASIINGYEAKCKGKKSRTELESMVRATTWLTAQEAVNSGLADGVLFEETTVPDMVVNCVGGGIRALAGNGGMPDLETMRAEYRRQKQAQAGEDPGADRPDWRAKAALDLEKMRF